MPTAPRPTDDRLTDMHCLALAVRRLDAERSMCLDMRWHARAAALTAMTAAMRRGAGLAAAVRAGVEAGARHIDAYLRQLVQWELAQGGGSDYGPRHGASATPVGGGNHPANSPQLSRP